MCRFLLPNKRSFLNPLAALGELSSLFHFFLECIGSVFNSLGGGVETFISEISGERVFSIIVALSSNLTEGKAKPFSCASGVGCMVVSEICTPCSSGTFVSSQRAGSALDNFSSSFM
ncbi:hypothetical protein CICLE_v10009955mg [Citrus x clementina]|uniref:Uncharacterized protein n=1 Tax=Citrus clementina TaxID=85681 RepID=V4UGH6_CITCL|nr:hypothetical protein CICLE_v10009955mg [Citrus x clementina]